MIDPDNLAKCVKDASKGKTKRREVKRALRDPGKTAGRLREILEAGKFRFSRPSMAVVNKQSERKERLIAKPPFVWDQIMHHALVSQFRPIVEHGLYEFACGSIPGRGPHYGKKHLRKWIDSYGNRRFYVFKADIRHFYDSIDHGLLKLKLRHAISDQMFMNLMESLIDSYGPGIPKGYYTSQWLANFLLKDFDHYVKQELKAPHYMRYMDDIVVLCPNKRQLHKIKDGIEAYLSGMRLELKGNWQIYRFVDKDDKNGRDIDFMGFRFYRHKTTLRKSNLRAIRRKANKIEKKRRRKAGGEGRGVTAHDAMSMLSYTGWTGHADVYGYYQRHIKPKVNRRALREKVSAAQKSANKRATGKE